MSRSGYSDGHSDWELIKWRGQVASAMKGKRGQALLVDLLAALEAMPVKRLIAHELQNTDGEVCALGAVGVVRNVDMQSIDPDEPEDVAAAFNIARPLACEIVYENDEHGHVKQPDGSWGPETPEQRYQRMKKWVAAHISQRAETPVRHETEERP